MSFNPDPSKQVQEVIFSSKTKKEYHPPLAFDDNNVSEINSQKHLGVVLNNRLSFEDHLKTILNKVTRAIKDTSREKLYKGLGLESLQLYRCFRNLSCFYKLFNSEHPHYLYKLIPSRSSSYVTRNIHNIPFFKTRHTFLKNSFFPSTIIEWK